MISVAVLYPNKAASKFDLDYYVYRHLPLVRDRLEPMGMRSLTYTVERAMDPAAPPQPYRLSPNFASTIWTAQPARSRRMGPRRRPTSPTSPTLRR
jgi:hypothetical protein